MLDTEFAATMAQGKAEIYFNPIIPQPMPPNLGVGTHPAGRDHSPPLGNELDTEIMGKKGGKDSGKLRKWVGPPRH